MFDYLTSMVMRYGC